MPISKSGDGTILFTPVDRKDIFEATGVMHNGQFAICDNIDLLKQLKFSTAAQQTNTTVTVASGANTSNITLTLPTTSGTLLTSASNGPAFGIVQTPAGTSPTATVASDTLTFTSVGGSLTITGNSSTDTVDFAIANPGGVTSVSVVSANGMAGTVATATTTPAITLSTSVTGILQGNGTAISAASTTGSGSVVLATNASLTTPALDTPSAIVLTNATGTAASLTSGKASNLTGGAGGSIPYQSAAATTAMLANGSSGQVLTSAGTTLAPTWTTPTTGTVTSASVVSANGLAGTVATPTTTPAITLSTTVTGILQGNGTAISAATTTGSGSVVLATSPTLVTPALGTPSAAVLTNATGTAASLTAGLATSLVGGSGGTIPYQSAAGTTAMLSNGTAGQILSSQGTTLAPQWIPAPVGTVTSVALSMPAEFAVSGSPVTGSGTLTAARPTLTATAKVANYTLLNTDYAIKVDNTSGAFAITMPSPSSNASHIYVITNIGTGTNVVTISPSASETFGAGALAALHLSTVGESYTLMSDGTNWMITSHYSRTAPATFTVSLSVASGTLPTKGTVVIDRAVWWREGQYMHVRWSYQQSAAGTSGGNTAVIQYSLPTGYTVNTTAQPASTTQFQSIGSAYSFFPSSATGPFQPSLYDSSHFCFWGGNTIDTPNNFNWAAVGTSVLAAELMVPITNWEA